MRAQPILSRGSWLAFCLLAIRLVVLARLVCGAIRRVTRTNQMNPVRARMVGDGADYP
ncbi:hypothetical protein D9M69_358020 [compost metagenome]